MSKANAQAVGAADSPNSLFIVQRNPGTVHSDRVARYNSTAETGRRYEVLERATHQWFLVTVLTVMDGGRRR